MICTWRDGTTLPSPRTTSSILPQDARTAGLRFVDHPFGVADIIRTLFNLAFFRAVQQTVEKEYEDVAQFAPQAAQQAVLGLSRIFLHGALNSRVRRVPDAVLRQLAPWGRQPRCDRCRSRSGGRRGRP
ncbi:hypothetical protein G6F31_019594 [Rhizopus arrhizus]|nr:hypothetical protein G6F31_019594 [Rhizopus arrhizus]